MQIKFERMDSNSLPVPQYKTAGAAAFDIAACLTRTAFNTGNGPKREPIGPSSELELLPGDIISVPTGWKVEYPENHVLILAVRSSTGIKGLSLANNIGVIDHDYRGELFVALHNTRDIPQIIKHGERIGQCMLMPVVQAELLEGKVAETTRGEGGLGSTGRM